tara:strand:- start:51 stop:854 length:804 start_codon:yes stop_codon:yes gene_type:complete
MKRPHYRNRNIFCGNCGKTGHIYKDCHAPVTSCGIILYKKVEGKYKYLLIQRKDSIGYIEFLRGKYDINNIDYIKVLLERMTIEEINNIKNNEFDILWNNLWLNRNIKQYLQESENSKRKFNELKSRKENNLFTIIDNTNITYIEKEWGFPKGRRNLKEGDFDCACREFEEETGYERKDYFILRNIRPLEEVFEGSNKIRYKHIYYIGLSRVDKKLEICKDNIHQITEIGNLDWFSFEEALQKIRPYNIEKKNVLKKLNKLLKANNC